MIRYVLRPCWVAGLGWLFTLLLCPWLSVSWQLALCGSAAVALCVSLCIPAVRRIHAVPLLAAVCLLALISYQAAVWVRVRPIEGQTGKPLSLCVQVTQTNEAVLLEVQSGALPKGTQLLLYLPDEGMAFERYDRFTATFTVEPYASGTKLTRLTRRAGGVRLRATVSDTTEISETLTHTKAPPSDVFVRLRERLAGSIEGALDGDDGAATAGICYGADERLSTAATESFRACGVSHLFAVSGLHMTVLLQGLLFLLTRLRVGRTPRALSGAVLLLCFMAIVGFSASVVRAGAVSLVMLVGNVLRRRADAKNSLGLALLVLLVPDPFAAYDVGLLLSFAATYGLLCWTRPILGVLLRIPMPSILQKPYRALASAVAVSTAAALATTPILALVTGSISLVSVPANLLTAAVSEVVLIAGCLASLFSVMGLTVFAVPFLFVAGLSSRYLLWICEKISAFSFATVATPTLFLLLWIVGVLAVVWFARRFLKTHGIAAVCGVCVCAVCVGFLLHRAVTHDVLRVGNATEHSSLSAVVSYRGGTVLVTAPGFMDSVYEARDHLHAFGASQFDAVFLLGGDDTTLSWLPLVLADNLSDNTQVLYAQLSYPPLDGVSMESVQAVRLGEAFEARWDDTQLTICWGEYTLVFTTDPTTNVTADAVFTTGERSLSVYADGVVRPIQADTVFLKNGHVYGVG